MERAGHKKSAAQRKYKKSSDKKVRFWVEALLADHVYIDLPAGRVHQLENGTADPHTE